VWKKILLFVVLVELFTALAVFSLRAKAVEETIYQVYDIERAMRLVTKGGDSFICLITTEGFGFTGESSKWVGFTCARIGVQELVWQFCRGTVNVPILICVPPETKLRGKDSAAAPRAKPDVYMEVQ
jgi:hypothetical protein